MLNFATPFLQKLLTKTAFHANLARQYESHKARRKKQIWLNSWHLKNSSAFGKHSKNQKISHKFTNFKFFCKFLNLALDKH